MSEEAFDHLVDIYRDDITVNYARALALTQGNDPIYPELVVGAGLRFLGGEYVKSINDIYGMSIKSAQRIIWRFLGE
jgi:hypothetical protein